MPIDRERLSRIFEEERQSLHKDEPTIGELYDMMRLLYELHKPVPRSQFDSEATVGYAEVCREDQEGWPCSTYRLLIGERRYSGPENSK